MWLPGEALTAKNPNYFLTLLKAEVNARMTEEQETNQLNALEVEFVLS